MCDTVGLGIRGAGPTAFGTRPGETGPAVPGLIRPSEMRDLSTSVEEAGDPGGAGGEVEDDETDFGFWTLGALRPLGFGRSCLRIFWGRSSGASGDRMGAEFSEVGPEGELAPCPRCCPYRVQLMAGCCFPQVYPEERTLEQVCLYLHSVFVQVPWLNLLQISAPEESFPPLSLPPFPLPFDPLSFPPFPPLPFCCFPHFCD